MTQSPEPMLTGEQRLKERRRKYLRYITIALLLGFFAGVFSGWLVGAYENGEIGLWLPLTATAASIIAIVWFTYDYFQRVDELDLMDNLWSHLIGLYGGVITYAAWFLLADLSLTPEPTAIGVVAALLGFTFLAYGARKLGWR